MADWDVFNLFDKKEGGYPMGKFFFRVNIKSSEGDHIISFKEVSGLDVEAEMVEYRTGASVSLTTMKKIGLVKTSNIIMKKGVIQGDYMLMKIFQKAFDKKNQYDSTADPLELTIGLLDPASATAAFTWRVAAAIPVKFSGGDYNSESNEISIEEIEFAHEGIRIEEESNFAKLIKLFKLY